MLIAYLLFYLLLFIYGQVMEQFIKVGKSGNAAFIQARLVAHLIPEDGGYVAHCPAFRGAISQGDTLKEAKANIKEAIELILEVSFERGTLAKRIAHLNAYERKSHKPPAANCREIRIPARIPLPSAA